MVIIWTEEADERVEEIYSFYEGKNEQAAKDIFLDIRRAVLPLLTFPYMAAIEPALESRPEGFRSLIVRGLFKIVYFVDKEREEIVIATVFDCRQNPEKLIFRLKPS